MKKTVILRLDDETYHLFKRLAKGENLSLSNFIETATRRYIENVVFTGELETAEIDADKFLSKCIRRGHRDSVARRGQFVKA